MDAPYLPPEFDAVLALLKEAPPGRRTLFWYAISLALVDDEKAHFGASRIVDGRELVMVHTITGESFEVVRPDISEEAEADLLEQMRAIIEEESQDGC